MTKRIKRVFGSAEQVLHLWANQSQDSARSSNVFFQGKDCYSYGYHYRLGTITEYKGVKIALINNRGYSVTTSKHISYAASAVRHMPKLYTQGKFDVVDSLKNDKASLESDMQKHFKGIKFSKGDSWNHEYNWLRERIEKHNKLCKLLKSSKYKVNVTAKYIKDYNAHIQKRLKRQEELNSPEMLAKRSAQAIRRAELKAEKARLAAEVERQKESEQIENWKNNKGPSTNAVRRIYPQIIRVNGSMVETSGGAQVSLNEARTLLADIVSGKVEGLILGQAKIGGFQLTDYEDGIVTIGCHKISLEHAKSVLSPVKLVKVG